MQLKTIIKKIIPFSILQRIKNKNLYRKLPLNFQKIIKNLEPSDVCIDCGANVGDVTSLFSSYGCYVYSFEPNPFAFKVLKSRFDNFKNIQLSNSAVGLKDSEIPLFFHNDYEKNPILFSEASSLMTKKMYLCCNYPNINFYRS